MTPLFPAKTSYPAEFEAEWKRFSGPKSSSKSDGLRARIQMAKFLPGHQTLLYCIDEYRAEIGKSRQISKHYASWLRDRRWEGYEDDARKRLLQAAYNAEQVAKDVQSLLEQYPLQRAAFMDLVPTISKQVGNPHEMDAYFGTAIYEAGPPPALRVKSAFLRDRIESKHGFMLRRVFGQGLTIGVIG